MTRNGNTSAGGGVEWPSGYDRTPADERKSAYERLTDADSGGA